MKILHVIRKTNDSYAWGTVSRHRERAENQVVVLLLHDAVFTAPAEENDTILACRDDVVARGVKTRVVLIGYEEIVKMLLEADSVVCW